MISKTTLNRWFYVFIVVHLCVWTLAPAWVRHVLPMDAIEGSIWGHQLEWGYDKNPFLNGWLTALALYLGDGYDWVVYLFCQLSIVICFYVVWQLAKDIMSPAQALIAVMLLEGMQYFNLHALDFNDNVLELSTWALTIFFFYHALLNGKWLPWILSGVFAALAMMTKYYSGVLLLPLFLFMFLNAKARQQFKNPAFYVSGMIFFVIITPHIVWLFSHDFVTLQYAMNRVDAPPTWQNHFSFPWQFAMQQLQVVIPAVVILVLAFPHALQAMFIAMQPSNRPLPDGRGSVKTALFTQHFILFISLSPFLLTLLISAAWGLKLRASWGQPLLSLWGILLLMWLKPEITLKRFYCFLIIFYILLTMLVGGYCHALIRAEKSSSANYPGKIIADTLTREWHDTYHTPLTYIAGSRWASGNIALYSQDHPSVYIDWNKKLSPWIDEKKLRKNGAIFIWEKDEANQQLPADIQKRFANMKNLTIRHFSLMRNASLEPVEISVAFLPPDPTA